MSGQRLRGPFTPLPDELLNSQFAQSLTDSHFRILVHLCQQARRSTAVTVRFNGEERVLEPGQALLSERQIADRSGKTKDQVRAAMKRFREAGFVSLESTTKGSIVTLTPWRSWWAEDGTGESTTESTTKSGTIKGELASSVNSGLSESTTKRTTPKSENESTTKSTPESTTESTTKMGGESTTESTAKSNKNSKEFEDSSEASAPESTTKSTAENSESPPPNPPPSPPIQENKEVIDKRESTTPTAVGSASADPSLDCDDRVVMSFPLRDRGEWHLTESALGELAEGYPGVDLDAEIRKAREWLRANPAKRKTANGMRRYLAHWLSRATQTPPPQTKNNGANLEERAMRGKSNSREDGEWRLGDSEVPGVLAYIHESGFRERYEDEATGQEIPPEEYTRRAEARMANGRAMG